MRYGEISVPAEVEQRGVLQNISDQLKNRSLSLQVQREVVGAILSLTLISRNCLLLFKSGTVEELLRLLVETKDEQLRTLCAETVRTIRMKLKTVVQATSEVKSGAEGLWGILDE